MSALLVYSPKCNFCIDIMNFVNSNQQLKQLVRFHNVNTQGVPPQYAKQINRVPTMLTKNGKLLIGNEIKQWLSSLLPNEITNCTLSGGMCGLSSLDDDDDDDSVFLLDNYGQSLQPAMTPELQNRISQNVNESFNNNNKR